MYDLNIDTLEASANKDDLERWYAYISLDYNSLSSANKEVAFSEWRSQITRADWVEIIVIKVLVSATTSIRVIEDAFVAEATKLVKQALSRSPIYSVEDVKILYWWDDNEYLDPSNVT